MCAMQRAIASLNGETMDFASAPAASPRRVTFRESCEHYFFAFLDGLFLIYADLW